MFASVTVFLLLAATAAGSLSRSLIGCCSWLTTYRINSMPRSSTQAPLQRSPLGCDVSLLRHTTSRLSYFNLSEVGSSSSYITDIMYIIRNPDHEVCACAQDRQNSIACRNRIKLDICCAYEIWDGNLLTRVTKKYFLTVLLMFCTWWPTYMWRRSMWHVIHLAR